MATYTLCIDLVDSLKCCHVHFMRYEATRDYAGVVTSKVQSSEDPDTLANHTFDCFFVGNIGNV